MQNGIAIQSFSKSAIISMPLKSKEMLKSKALLYSALSGISEPIGAILTIALIKLVISMDKEIYVLTTHISCYIMIINCNNKSIGICSD